jgi:tRNA nucleotidyltransferase (CCA-adding enzyme)
MTLPPQLDRILRGNPNLQEAYVVGGSVRDWLLGRPVKDFDIEVFGVSEQRLLTTLRPHGRVDQVGRSFGVFKVTVPSGETYDFSLPRRDSKVAPGHIGFEIQFDPALDPLTASSRRDFTINSMMWHPDRQQLLDLHGGQADLRAGILRHTSAAFPEDPLRVLRGMQFAGRFNLVGSPETLAMARSIQSSYPELARERVREEWYKWALQSTVPSAGLRFLKDSGWLTHFPELQSLIGQVQDVEWHPEGDVWNHTLHCLDALVQLQEWNEAASEQRMVWAWTVLLHDSGKVGSTREDLRDGRIRIVSPGHEIASLPRAEVWMNRIGVSMGVQERVLPLIANHMIHRAEVSPRSVRRLAQRLAPASIAELTVVLTADAHGRPPRPKSIPPVVPLLLAEAAAQAISNHAPKPILQGRHLLEWGWNPGPQFTPVLARALDAQLDGVFADLEGARRWLEVECGQGKS